LSAVAVEETSVEETTEEVVVEAEGEAGLTRSRRHQCPRRHRR
jgi:hypothetical protein